MYESDEKDSKYLPSQRKKHHIGSYWNGDKVNKDPKPHNWLNLATEMHDNEASHILHHNTPGNIFCFHLKCIVMI